MGRAFCRGFAFLFCAHVVCAGTVEAGAVSFSADRLDDFCGGNAQLIGDCPEVILMSSAGIRAEIISAACSGASGGYTSFSQIKNAAMADTSTAERPELGSFPEADDNTSVDWSRGGVPAGFLYAVGRFGNEDVDNAIFADVLPERPIISYDFTRRYGEVIGDGSHGKVLYAGGSSAAENIPANVVGGGVSDGEIARPVIPEPVAIIYLAMAGLASFVAMVARR